MRLLGWMYFFFFFFFPVIQYLLTVAGDSSVCNTFGAGVALSFRQSLDNEKKISKNVFREPPKKENGKQPATLIPRYHCRAWHILTTTIDKTKRRLERGYGTVHHP